MKRFREHFTHGRRYTREFVATITAVLMIGSLAITGSVVNAVTGANATWFSSAQQAGGVVGAAATGSSVAVTSNDTSIITGSFEGTVYFPTSADDSIALTSAGSLDIYVAALNADDSYFAWATRAGGGNNDEGTSVAVTTDDTVIITGLFAGTAYFPTSADDSIALTSAGSFDMFVAALNADDSYFAWATRAGGTSVDQALSVASTIDDTPIITGYFAGTAYFPTSADDSIALTSTGGSEIFVAALNADDSYFAWATRAGGTGPEQGNSVAVTTKGAPIITGSFFGTTYFPTSAEDSIALTTASNDDIFVAALNTDDSYFAWATRAGGNDFESGQSIAVTTDGAPVIIGYFGGSATFPTGPATSITLTSAGFNDIFVAALKPDGSYFAWATRAGGAESDIGASVELTTHDIPVITGYFLDTAYFPTAADDSIALTSTGGGDIFVAALNTDSPYFAWAIRAGGPAGADSAQGSSVAITKDDTAIITGWFAGTAYFPTAADDSLALTSAGALDVFAARLAVPFSPTPPVPPTPALPPSAPQSVTGVAGEASGTITWAAPASEGSLPVSSYQVVITPGGKSCLTPAPTVTCSVTGLTNGTTYTAIVRALNGAGWGPYSAASNTFTPQRTVTPSITITGIRGEVRGATGILISGTAQGFGLGGMLTPWMRFPGQSSYNAGSARILVSQNGQFTWQRRTGKKIYVVIRNSDGTVKSNRLTIDAR